MKKFNYRYSGKDSQEVWDAINSLPSEDGGSLYSCFVLLQNMESTCLVWLNNAIDNHEKNKAKDE